MKTVWVVFDFNENIIGIFDNERSADKFALFNNAAQSVQQYELLS